jgi:hypothetical protein
MKAPKKKDLTIRCPECGAGLGENCLSTAGLTRIAAHLARFLLATSELRTGQN